MEYSFSCSSPIIGARRRVLKFTHDGLNFGHSLCSLLIACINCSDCNWYRTKDLMFNGSAALTMHVGLYSRVNEMIDAVRLMLFQHTESLT